MEFNINSGKENQNQQAQNQPFIEKKSNLGSGEEVKIKKSDSIRISPSQEHIKSQKNIGQHQIKSLQTVSPQQIIAYNQRAQSLSELFEKYPAANYKECRSLLNDPKIKELIKDPNNHELSKLEKKLQDYENKLSKYLTATIKQLRTSPKNFEEKIQDLKKFEITLKNTAEGAVNKALYTSLSKYLDVEFHLNHIKNNENHLTQENLQNVTSKLSAFKTSIKNSNLTDKEKGNFESLSTKSETEIRSLRNSIPKGNILTSKNKTAPSIPSKLVQKESFDDKLDNEINPVTQDAPDSQKNSSSTDLKYFEEQENIPNNQESVRSKKHDESFQEKIHETKESEELKVTSDEVKEIGKKTLVIDEKSLINPSVVNEARLTTIKNDKEPTKLDMLYDVLMNLGVNQKLVYYKDGTFGPDDRSKLSLKLNFRSATSSRAKKTIQELLLQVSLLINENKKLDLPPDPKLFEITKKINSHPWLKLALKNYPELAKSYKKRIENIQNYPSAYTIQNMMINQNLIIKGRDICWADKKDLIENPIPTGQNYEKLLSTLKTHFKAAELGSNIGIKLKSGESANKSGLKHGGQTFTVFIDDKGKVSDVSQKTKKVGRGAFGKVEALKLNDGTVQAAKFAYVEKKGDNQETRLKKAEKDIRNEHSKGQLLKDVVGFVKPSKLIMVIRGGHKESKLGILTELYEGDAVITPTKKWSMTWSASELGNAAFDMINALSDCHKLGVCLGDIKTDNVLIKDRKVYLADLGAAANKEEMWVKGARKEGFLIPAVSQKTTCGDDIEALQKELLDKNGPYFDIRKKMDVFSLGCTIFEILAGEIPHIYKNPKSVQVEGKPVNFLGDVLSKEEIKKALQTKFNEQNADKFATLISNMLEPHWNNRPSMDEVAAQIKELEVLFNYERR